MTIRKMTTMAIFLALALIIFIIESFLPPLAPIPGIKLGLSNIITLMAIYLLGRKEGFIILVMRIILSSVFTGTLASFFYSLAGGIVCYVLMAFMSFKLTENRMWAVSVMGAIGHNIGQIAVACFLIGKAQIIWYLPVLMISAVLTGTFTGIAAQFTVSRLRKTGVI